MSQMTQFLKLLVYLVSATASSLHHLIPRETSKPLSCQSEVPGKVRASIVAVAVCCRHLFLTIDNPSNFCSYPAQAQKQNESRRLES